MPAGLALIDESTFDAETKALLINAYAKIIGAVEGHLQDSDPSHLIHVRQTVAEAIIALVVVGQTDPSQIQRYALWKAAELLRSRGVSGASKLGRLLDEDDANDETNR